MQARWERSRKLAKGRRDPAIIDTSGLLKWA